MKKLKISAVCLSLVCAMAAVQARGDVRICRLANGVDVLADNTGSRSVSSAFQRCIDENVPTMIMDLPPGRYLVDVPIQVIRSGRTIRTAGLSGNIKGCQQLGDAACAVFVASTDPAACVNNPDSCGGEIVQNGILQAGRVTINKIPQGPKVMNVIFDHLVIDGQGGARQNTNARKYCNGDKTPQTARYGFNSRMACDGTTQAEHCEYTFNFTRNALCGTGLEFGSPFGRVQGNAAFNNGIHTYLLWADGLTVSNADHGIVNDNHVANNSDVGLIVGSCAGGTVNSNWIEQKNGTYAFAGLMIGNFCETGTCQKGDYRGAFIRFNTIDCTSLLCGFGINFGPDPFSDGSKDNILGGQADHNTVKGARVPVNFGGAGTSNAHTVLAQNTITSSLAQAMPVDTSTNCMAQPAVLVNLKNNDQDVNCGNWVDTDVTSQSHLCFANCFPPPPPPH